MFEKVKKFCKEHKEEIMLVCGGIVSGIFIGTGIYYIGKGYGYKNACTDAYKKFENIVKLPGEEGLLVSIPGIGNLVMVGESQLKSGFDKAVSEEVIEKLAELTKEK